MNFQNLQYFLAVAEEGSITRAAERLFISQQALSNHITRLEEELGCRLFTRKPNLELTYAGKYFQSRRPGSSTSSDRRPQPMGDINGSRRGELRIGISYTRGQAILPLLLPDFHRAYPLVELSVVEGSTKELESDLSRGLIDVLIGFTPFLLESAVTRELAREQLFLVAPSALLKDAFGSRAGDVLDAFRENHDLRVFPGAPLRAAEKGRPHPGPGGRRVPLPGHGAHGLPRDGKHPDGVRAGGGGDGPDRLPNHLPQQPLHHLRPGGRLHPAAGGDRALFRPGQQRRHRHRLQPGPLSHEDRPGFHRPERGKVSRPLILPKLEKASAPVVRLSAGVLLRVSRF